MFNEIRGSWDEDGPFNKRSGRNSKRYQTKNRKFPLSQKQTLQDLASQNNQNYTSDNILDNKNSVKKLTRDRSRKKQQKYRNSIDESSDESESLCLSPRSRSNSMISSSGASPTKLSVEQVAAALMVASPPVSLNNFSSISSRHHRTPSFGGTTTVDGGLRQLNPHQLQHSPYYRALFGSPAMNRILTPSSSFKSNSVQSQSISSVIPTSGPYVDISATSDEESELSGQSVHIRRRRADSVDIRSDCLASAGTTADGSSEEELSSSHQSVGLLKGDDYALKATNLFGGDEVEGTILNSEQTETHRVENREEIVVERKAATAWNQEQLASISNEDFWPSLPPKTQRQTSVGRGISFAPSTLLRSPGRLGSNRKTSSTSTKLHVGEPKKWLRSDKYLNKLLMVSGSSAKKTVLRPRDSTPSPISMGDNENKTVDSLANIASPRRLRFPEPGSSVSPSSSYKSLPSPLFATTSVDSPGGGGFRTNNGLSFSPIQMLPFSSLTPDRHKIMSAYGGNINGNRELSPESMRVTPIPLTPSTAEPSAATSFKQSLTPGVLSSPSPALNTHHHHISFARYLAMTTGATTPSAVSRSTTADELQLLAEEEDNTNLLLQSCYSELDPQRVVRVLHDAVLANKASKGSLGTSPGGGFGLMSHSMRSLSVGLNLCSLTGANENTPRRVKRWDDPDSDSEEDEALEGQGGMNGSDLSVLFDGVEAKGFFRATLNQGGDGGFTNHSGYLQSVLARCSYFRTMTTERAHPVDANWFHSQVYPAYYSPKAGRELLMERMTAAKVLSGYVSSGLFYHLTSSLNFEDDRVASSRMAVLKAFYLQAPSVATTNNIFVHTFSDDQCDGENINSVKSNKQPVSSIRLDILSAMEHSTHSRLARCMESSDLSQHCEVDANHIAKRGYLGCGDNSTLSQNAVLTGCSIGAVTGSADERPAYKTRDSDASMLEMFKFIVACEIKEGAAQLRDQQDVGSGASKVNTRARALDGGILMRIAANVFINMFRCYGFKLGNSSELVEQPDLLNSLTEALEGLLLWAHCLSVSLHCSADTYHTTDKTTGNEPLFNTVSRFLLQGLFRHWSDRCNFGQDMAFIRVTEILLTVYTPVTPQVMQVGEASVGDKDRRGLPSLLSKTSPTAEGVARRCLLKICRRLGSHHFKVAMQALSCLQNASILRKYVLPTFRPADRYLCFDQNQSSYRELTAREAARSLPVLNGMLCVGFSTDLREMVLNTLVEALRTNRSHWHPVVQQSCSSALDVLLDRLQELEDEADERADREEAEAEEESYQEEDEEMEKEEWPQSSGEEQEDYDDEQGNYL